MSFIKSGRLNKLIFKISTKDMYEKIERIWGICKTSNFAPRDIFVPEKGECKALHPGFLPLREKIINLNPNTQFNTPIGLNVPRKTVSLDGACEDCGSHGVKVSVPRDGNFLITGENTMTKAVCFDDCKFHCPECHTTNKSKNHAGYHLPIECTHCKTTFKPKIVWYGPSPANIIKNYEMYDGRDLYDVHI